MDELTVGYSTISPAIPDLKQYYFIGAMTFQVPPPLIRVVLNGHSLPAFLVFPAPQVARMDVFGIESGVIDLC